MAETKKAARVEATRRDFRSLLVANPNYFGTAPGLGKAVKKIAGNTSYEQLTTLGYNPDRKQLFATLDIKKTFGYGGDLCADGTREYVRFYVDLGSGWQDAGMAAVGVNDIPAGKDCANKSNHPLSPSVEVPYAPRRRWCTSPQLPRARAILSWNVAPPAGQPDWTPVYGNVVECNIQIDKGWTFPYWVGELVEKVDIPSDLLDSIVLPELPDFPIPGDPFPPEPIPGPDPVIAKKAALSVSELAELYSTPTKGRSRKLAVEPQRFAFGAVQQLQLASTLDLSAQTSLAASLANLDIDISKLVAAVEDTTGNIDYEELEDVGLDPNLGKLTATYRVKKPSGFSGGLCTDGSTEYVAFWADWDNTCEWTYLGTVPVAAYDFAALPDGGLCYTADLPVDLTKLQRPCDEPKIARVRAVLSWNTAPSTTDPDDVPHWGNRLDAHVVVPPGPQVIGVTPTLTAVGGIGVPYIDDVTGLTTAGAVFIDNGLPADDDGRPCPFGRRVVVRGPSFPGHRYRVRVRETGTAVWTTLTTKLWVTSTLGFGSYHTIDPDGWFSYLPYAQNFAGILAYFDTTGDAKWEIRLEIEGVAGAATQVVQLDNTGPSVAVSITSPAGDCGLITPGVTLQGTATATDAYMGSWSVVIDGGPAGFGPEAATTAANQKANTPGGGAVWTYDTNGLVQCGYVVRVHAQDRSILNSVKSNHHNSVDVGFCVIEDNS